VIVRRCRDRGDLLRLGRRLRGLDRRGGRRVGCLYLKWGCRLGRGRGGGEGWLRGGLCLRVML